MRQLGELLNVNVTLDDNLSFATYNYTPIQRHFISQKFQLQGEVPWTDTLQVKNQTSLKGFLYSFLSFKGEIGFQLQCLLYTICARC